MSPRIRHALIAPLAIAVLAGLPTPASAGIWTPVASGTSETIQAIEYQGGDRFWFTTANGKIFKRGANGAFGQVGDGGLTLSDIAFQPGGDVGIAVGQGGTVMRSTNGGASWSKIPAGAIPARNVSCDPGGALGSLTAVRFASASRVYLFASAAGVSDGTAQIARSEDGGATWADANAAGNECKIAGTVSDGFFPSADVGYFMRQHFGETYLSSDNLGTTALLGDGPNGFQNVHRLAGDPNNQNRQWSLTPESGNSSYFQLTETGWRSESGWDLQTPGVLSAGYDVAFAGGTVLAAGDAGMILNSTDGKAFSFAPADGANAGTAWRAVGLASGTAGAVGGTGGALVVTDAANQVAPAPDAVGPRGDVAGPATIGAGAPAVFTANVADNAGGRGLDPASFTWSATNQPNVTGPTATFTWPAPGRYTINLTFYDLAGNAGTASQRVTVTKGVGVLPTTGKPPIKVTRSGSKVKVRVKGRLKIPVGIARAKGCKGNVIATVKKGRRLITARVIKLSKRCAFTKTITLRRSKVGKARKLRVTLRLEGNQIIGTTRRTYSLKVPRR